jgi:hypothetical protein
LGRGETGTIEVVVQVVLDEDDVLVDAVLDILVVEDEIEVVDDVVMLETLVEEELELVLEDEVGLPATTVAGLAVEVWLVVLDEEDELVLDTKHALEPTPAVGVFVGLPGMIKV